MTRDEISAFFAGRQPLWTARDADGLAAGHAPDSIVVSPMFGRLQGRAAIRDAYAALFRTFPDWDLQIEDLLIDGSRVAQSFSVSATHVGDFMGYAGTNRRFEIHGVRLFEMGDGLIRSEKRLYDFTGLLIQIGVLRSKPGKA
jgi:steroid delta-isomerase-like uncharacterized protein